MWLDNIKDWTQWKGREDEEGLERCGWITCKVWTQWKGREDEEGLERCGWITSKTGHSGREEKTRKD